MTDSIAAPLASYARDIYSQSGEDGIIGEILNRIGSASQMDGWCVEFGAWDGIHLSNTYNLIKNRGYRAVLIEGDAIRHKQLCKNIPSADIIKICQFVNFEGDASLGSILKKTPIPEDFDFLSIDIDGCDYFILESLTDYRPKLVCIEYNPTIPNEVEFVQPKDFSVKQGSSAKSLTRLAEKMGYALVAVTHCNLFFVRNAFKNAVVGSDDVSLDALRDDAAYRSFIFCGFDGTILTNRSAISMPWHNIELDSEALQQLPRYLRRLPPDYSPLQQILFEFFLAFKFPKTFCARLAKKLSR
ncbi:MAG: FkbM family methyltransferase [Rhizomicrobium sp.]